MIGIADFAELTMLCDERGIHLFSDEVYHGLERDPAGILPQAADLSERALSLNVTSTSLGLPGLRIGWITCRDRALLSRLEFCTRLVEEAGVLLLPASTYHSDLTPTPTDRFRIGIGRDNSEAGLAAFAQWLRVKR